MKTKKLSAKSFRLYGRNQQLRYRVRRNQPLHKRFFLHPLTVFLYMSIGVFLVFITVRVSALTFSVTAKVPAPLITTAAKIQVLAPSSIPTQSQATTAASTQQTAISTTNKQVILSGECPKDSHLEFYRNNIFAGATPCIGDPTFSIKVDLVQGLNAIQARVFNITDDEGPISENLYVNYEPPVVTIDTTTPASENTSAGSAVIKAPSIFVLTSDFKFLGFYTGEQATWNISIKDGTAPYNFVVNWGDDTKQKILRSDSSTFAITHTYKKASGNTGYVINIDSTDAEGGTGSFQLMAIISDRGTKQAGLIQIANAQLSPSLIKTIQKWLWVIWPGYVIMTLMLLSFWLGEHEEYIKVKNKLSIRRRH